MSGFAAIARGWKSGANVMKRDSYLKALRAREDFQKLRAGLEAGSAKP